MDGQFYSVSYRQHDSNCGNKTGTLAEVVEYADQNKHNWSSHSFLVSVHQQFGVSTMVEVDRDGNRINA
jgi:hypothetical protein